MPSLLLNDRVLVTAIGRLCGQRTMNTFLYRVSAATAGNDMGSSFVALHAELTKAGALWSALNAACPSNWTFEEAWYQVVAPARFRKGVSLVASQGGWQSAAQTANVHIAITRVGEQAKRKYVGGIRVPMATDAATSADGVPTPAFYTVVQALVNAMKLTVITVNPQVTFIPQVGAPRDANQSIDLYDAFYQRSTRVNRRRTVGLGI